MTEVVGYQLEPVEHGKIFRNQILRVADLVAFSQHTHPLAIVLVRPPGTSGHGLVHLAKRELHFDVLAIADEELVEYHPQIAAMREQHPYTWPEKVRADAVYWANDLISAGVQERVNLLIDMPTEAVNLDRLVEHLFNHRYRVEIRCLVVHRLQAELAMQQRFARSFELNGCGRHMRPELCKPVEALLPDKLDGIYSEPRVAIRLFDWKGNPLYDSRDQGRLPSKALVLLGDQQMKDPVTTKATRDGWDAHMQWERDLPKLVDRMVGRDGTGTGSAD